MGQTTIKISDRAWLALKQVQVDFEGGKAPECRTFRQLLDAIAAGNDLLLMMFREKYMAIEND